MATLMPLKTPTRSLSILVLCTEATRADGAIVGDFRWFVGEFALKGESFEFEFAGQG